jgi:septal ring factor EnvC (AmiA/AmiB activator)
MDTQQWLWIIGAALASAAAGVAACHWQMSRTIAALRDRIERAEQARNGALERSAKAREQIAQLNQAIADIRKSQSMSAVAAATTTADERRARAEQALAAAARSNDESPLMSRRDTPKFADTEVLAGQD